MRGVSFSLDGPGRLSAEKLHSPHGEFREHSNPKHDDAHATDPLGQRSPQQDRAREDLHVGEDGRTSRGEPRCRLEQCIHGERDAVLQHVRHRADYRCQKPRGADEQKRLAPAERELFPLVEVPLQKQAERGREGGGHVECPTRVFSEITALGARG